MGKSPTYLKRDDADNIKMNERGIGFGVAGSV
jgi:hypothetical protein